MEYKTQIKCKACGLVKPAKEYWLSKIRGNIVYRKSVCKKCQAWKSQQLRELNNKGKGQDKFDYTLEEFSDALVELSRYNKDRIEHYPEEKFLKKTNSSDIFKNSNFKYKDIRKRAIEKLTEKGYTHPEQASFGKGLYVIFGDSHGKHTKRPMFNLINQLLSFLKPDKVFHIGHMMDDDDDISYLWNNIKNLVIIPKREELSDVHKKGFPIIRGSVFLGGLEITNQDMITDHVLTKISGLDPIQYDGDVIVNCHRHERASICTDSNPTMSIMSVGCLCEPHIIKTVKQIDFTNGYRIRETYPDSYHKYRRSRHLNKYWEQGFAVVFVDENNKHHVVQCRIKTDKKGEKITAFFDKIIHSKKGRCIPDDIILATTDAHVPNHSPKVMAVQEKISEMFKPDKHVDMGDLFNIQSLNPHNLSRSEVIKYATKDYLEEMVWANYISELRKGWANETFFIKANHERFVTDFINKHPQLENILNYENFIKDKIDHITNIKDCLKIGPVKFLHGDAKLFGARGIYNEKAARTYKTESTGSVLFGHVHYPSIRMGVYSVGLTGNLDQDYNETNASKWLNGAALVIIKDGISFVNLLDIIDDNIWLGDKNIEKIEHYQKWAKLPEYNVEINIEFKKEGSLL